MLAQTTPSSSEVPDQPEASTSQIATGASVQSPAVPTSQGTPSVSGGFLAIALLLLFALVGGLFVMRARKKLLAVEPDTHSAGLLLDDMRAMLRRGEISQEEFDATRKAMAAKLRTAHGLAADAFKK